MSFQILSAEQLEQITGMKRYTSQVAWFKENFNVRPVCRPDGSIVLTQATFEALLMKKLGLTSAAPKPSDLERPKLRPVFPDR